MWRNGRGGCRSGIVGRDRLETNVYRYSGFDVHTMDLFFLCRSDEDMSDLKAHDDVAECFWLRREEIEPEKFAFQSIRKAVDRLLKDDKYWVKD